jgi:DNA-directed RNA polymerase III subunit RPC8
VVRFQIDDEHWCDQTPVGPSEMEEDVKKSPYTLTASMQNDGLGPCLWWDDSDVVEE